MSEQEFELYLKLLSRCLGLTPSQREHIADELRDHLEERLEELVREGVRRDQAVIQALDEFGDASALAAHFTTIARMRRRRLVMRLSLGSVAALAAGLLVALALWPDGNALQGPARVVAETTERDPDLPPLVKVEVAQPIVRDVPDSRTSENGLTEPSRKVEIRARVSGYLLISEFKNGGAVNKGDYLFYLDGRPYEVDLARATAQLQQAQARADRFKAIEGYTEALVKDKVISDREVRQRTLEWKEAQAAFRSAQADVQTAQIDVDYTKLAAPISGHISRPKIDEGNLVTADQTVLATLTCVDPLTVKFILDEDTFLELRQAVRKGDVRLEDIPIAVALSGESDFLHQARLDSLDADVNGSSVELRASLPNPDQVLVPGQRALVRITTSKPKPGLLVPLKTIGRNRLSAGIGLWSTVSVVAKDGKVDNRGVKICGADGDFAVIREGLQPEEWVMKSLQDVQGAREGQLVEPVRTKFEP